MAADSDFKNEIRQKTATWERHVQSILLAITLSTVGFCAKFMWDMNSQMSKVITHLDVIQREQTEFRNIAAGLAINYVPRSEFNYVLERLRTVEQSQRENRTK